MNSSGKGKNKWKCDNCGEDASIYTPVPKPICGSCDNEGKIGCINCCHSKDNRTNLFQPKKEGI
jgi:hypothetical protein